MVVMAKKRKRAAAKAYSLDYGVSQSMLLRWLMCRQEAKYYVDGWRVPETAVAPWFGQLAHDINDNMYDSFRRGKFSVVPDRDITDGLLAEAEKKLMKQAKKVGKKAVENAEMMMTWAEALLLPYCQYWKDDFKKGIWEALESEFLVEWEGYKLKGRRDGLRWAKPKKGKKSLWMMETKTKGRIEEGTLLDTLAFDFQNEFYLTGSDVELGDKKADLKGVLYNIIRRPNQKLKGGEDLKEYGARIREDVEKRPDHYFKRFEVTYPQQEREWFKKDLLAIIQEFELWLRDERPTYRQQCSCTMGRRCDFIPACSSGTMKGFVQSKDLKKMRSK